LPEWRGGLIVKAVNESAAGKSADCLRTFTLRNRDIEAAAHLLRVLVVDEHQVGRGIVTSGAGKVDTTSERSILIGRARQVYMDRARRGRIFSNVMFGEAAWDMLLALYITDQRGAPHTVSGLAKLSGAPQSTALRWLEFLDTKEGLVRRKPTSTDRRIFTVELTDKGREVLDVYFSEDIGEMASVKVSSRK
jgi:DNA-binding MarR family transcriptional regulator